MNIHLSDSQTLDFLASIKADVVARVAKDEKNITLFTASEAAERMNISKRDFLRLKVAAVQVSPNRFRYSLSAIEEWIEQHKETPRK